MALRLRRGTEAERSLITPASGELIYTTDTKRLYVGDGTTVGGNPVSGRTNLSELDDVGTALVPPTDGQVLAWDAVTEQWLPSTVTSGGLTGDGVVEGSNYRINIVGADSSLIVDAGTNTLTGNFFGNINATGVLDGELTGSVFGDDSGLLVDGVNNIIAGNVNNGSVFTTSLDVVNEGNDISLVRLFSNTTGGANDFEFNSHRGSFELPTNLSVGDGIFDITAKGYHTDDYRPIGLIRFRTDQGGSFNNPTSGLPGSILFSVFNNNGGQDLQGTMELTQRGLVVNTFGDYGPESLKVGGDAKITGTLTVSQLVGDVRGSVFGDDSTVLVDAVNNTIPGYISISELKTLTAGSIDFADFQAKIALL